MIRPLWAALGAAAIGTATVAGVVVALPGDGEEEVPSQVQSTETPAAASPRPTPAAASSPSQTAVPGSPSPPPAAVTSAPIPVDWATFTFDRVPEVTLRYPPDWYVEGRRLTSFDPATWTGGFYPPGGILVDLDRIPVDPNMDQLIRPPEAKDTTVGGLPAWEFECTGDVSADCANAPWAKVHYFVVEASFKYAFFGYFAEKDADEATFLLMVLSVRFTL